VWERLVPQPFQPWEAKLDLAEFYRAGRPKSYIAVADDRALPEGTWHPGMSSRLGPCKIVPMAGSHEVMFTRPGRTSPQPRRSRPRLNHDRRASRAMMSKITVAADGPEPEPAVVVQVSAAW
jgi:hypothetical protein